MAVISERTIQLLVHLNEALSTMSGRNGTFIYSGTTAYTNLNFTAIAIREDATAFSLFTMIDPTGAGPNLALSDIVLGGATLIRGDLLRVPAGYIVSAFTLSAGSIQAT